MWRREDIPLRCQGWWSPGTEKGGRRPRMGLPGYMGNSDAELHPKNGVCRKSAGTSGSAVPAPWFSRESCLTHGSIDLRALPCSTAPRISSPPPFPRFSAHFASSPGVGRGPAASFILRALHPEMPRLALPLPRCG